MSGRRHFPANEVSSENAPDRDLNPGSRSVERSETTVFLWFTIREAACFYHPTVATEGGMVVPKPVPGSRTCGRDGPLWRGCHIGVDQRTAVVIRSVMVVSVGRHVGGRCTRRELSRHLHERSLARNSASRSDSRPVVGRHRPVHVGPHPEDRIAIPTGSAETASIHVEEELQERERDQIFRDVHTWTKLVTISPRTIAHATVQRKPTPIRNASNIWERSSACIVCSYRSDSSRSRRRSNSSSSSSPRAYAERSSSRAGSVDPEVDVIAL